VSTTFATVPFTAHSVAAVITIRYASTGRASRGCSVATATGSTTRPRYPNGGGARLVSSGA
jgi:hypothetical protein